MNKKYLVGVATCVAVFGLVGCTVQPSKEEEKLIAKKEQLLGQQLFFDNLLSKDQTQSCSTCHDPKQGFVDSRDNGVRGAGSLGDDGKSIGDRNAPPAGYAMFSPDFHFDKEKGHFKGGQFWDGRETHLKGQAGGPPLNPVEMAIPSKEEMAKRLEANSSYNIQFKELYGEDIFKDAVKTYDRMAQAIGEFEKTKEFAPFDSKYDRYLRGEYDLTVLEDLGRSIFFSNNNTNCASCHMLKVEDAKGETFTNYRYHNIGVPSNQELMAKNVVDPETFIDHGLMNNPAVKNLPNASDYNGKMKVPSLRNIAVTGPYMHNGKFQKLSTVVKFYDKYINKERKINPETRKAWEDAEVKVGKEDLKLLQEGRPLSERKVKALVAFMNLLTDKRYEHLIKEDN
jgi:cytochrome c peroxidase